MIKIGCSGYSVATKKYQSLLDVVELEKLSSSTPKNDTLARWKETAPHNFEFVVCAADLVGKPHRAAYKKVNQGHFSGAVQKAIHQAKTLSAKVIYFELPNQFSPNADNVTRLQNFFARAERGHLQFVWNPPTQWPLSMIERVSTHLKLVPAQNPLATKISTQPAFNYFRINRHAGEFIDNHSFEMIKRACTKKLSYVVFDNGPTSFESASTFRNWMATPC